MIYRNQLIISVCLLFFSSFLYAENYEKIEKRVIEYTYLNHSGALNEKIRLVISFGDSLTKEKLSIARINEYSWVISKFICKFHILKLINFICEKLKNRLLSINYL